jgi:omega-hydroxy-beta-dihydromenaquinone-9 sulfotransferase
MSYFQKTGLLRFDQQFLAGGSFSNWLGLLRDHGGVDLRYWPRLAYISAVALLAAPVRAYERRKFGALIECTELHEPPIFILGHWRSGTTYVQRLVAQNSEFAVVNFIHTMIPGLFLTGGLFKFILRASLPETRPMDNVEIGPEFADEEEYALGNLSPYSFYHALAFPRRMREIFDRYVLFEDVSDRVRARWLSIYHRFLKKISFSSGGRQLLLKNPANTARVKMLLELFPNAKFIHVYRNPFVVYSSTINWLDKEMVPTALQDVEEDVIREAALVNYEKLMRKYLAERVLIPEGNLVEVRFEDVEADPLAETLRIYRALGLTMSSQTRTRLASYIASTAGYKKNHYHLSPDRIATIQQRWGFAIETWGYHAPEGVDTSTETRDAD